MKIYAITDLAYLAGIIDGEGSIGLYKNHQGLAKGRRTPSYVLRLRIKMCDELIIRWIHSFMGGRFYGGYANGGRGYSRDIYEWSVVGEEAVRVLHLVYPYLKLKRFQADIGFEFGKTLNGGGRRLSYEVVEERESLRDKMIFLNRRGVDKEELKYATQHARRQNVSSFTYIRIR